jgi:hypothetical protein
MPDDAPTINTRVPERTLLIHTHRRGPQRRHRKTAPVPKLPAPPLHGFASDNAAGVHPAVLGATEADLASFVAGVRTVVAEAPSPT